MIENEIRSVIKELLLETQYKDPSEWETYGVYGSKGEVLYKVLAANPRHGAEKIQALHGVDIPFQQVLRLPSRLKLGSIPKEKPKEKKPRLSRWEKARNELIEYFKKKNFEIPFTVVFKDLFKLDVNTALNQKNLITVNHITSDNEIVYFNGMGPIKTNVYIRVDIFKSKISKLIKTDLNEFKEKLLEHFNYIVPSGYRSNYDFRSKYTINIHNIQTDGKILQFEWECVYRDEQGGIGLTLISESTEDDNIDPDISGKPYGEDDIWPGSDIEGIKQHGTGMSHGYGYPNWRQKSKLTKKDIEDILHIRYIEGVSEEDEIKQSKIDQQSVRNYINKNCPWVLTFAQEDEWQKGKFHYPFAGYFGNWETTMWNLEFSSAVKRQLNFHVHWKRYKQEDIVQSNFPHCGIETAQKRFEDTQEIIKNIPTFEQDLLSLLQLCEKLRNFSPSNPRNPSVYPLFVSLYDTTRRLGGHEEGGWWYNQDGLVHSIPVKDYKQMRQAVVMLLKMLSEADLNGKPLITLEKQSGGRENKPPPSYS